MKPVWKSKVSLIVPVYNEANRLQSSIIKVKKALQNLGVCFEIIITEDGSTDGSGKIAEELEHKDPVIKHLHSDRRLGRGEALKRAFKVSTGDVFIYTDIDLSTDLRHLEDLLEAIEKGADIAVGSRLIKGAHVKRPFPRNIASRLYNNLVRLLLRSPLHDHQCGFKAFKRSSVIDIISEVEDKYWFWDTEVIIRAVKQGYSVVEVPVTWTYSRTSKVRLLKDMRYMGINLLKLWWQLGELGT